MERLTRYEEARGRARSVYAHTGTAILQMDHERQEPIRIHTKLGQLPNCYATVRQIFVELHIPSVTDQDHLKFTDEDVGEVCNSDDN